MRTPSEFKTKDWEMIFAALQSYCLSEEARLALLNAGEWEWAEYNNLEKLTVDVECYLIGESNDE